MAPPQETKKEAKNSPAIPAAEGSDNREKKSDKEASSRRERGKRRGQGKPDENNAASKPPHPTLRQPNSSKKETDEKQKEEQERSQLEEAQKLKEEALRKEEEEKRARELEEQRIRDEEIAAKAEEARKAIKARRDLRAANLSPARPDECFLKGLDSSIKRCTGVIKKLRTLGEEQRATLVEEVKGVNLSKYVSEAVTAICEAKLRTGDVAAAVQVCSALHQRYADFAPALIPALVKQLLVPVPVKSASGMALAQPAPSDGDGGDLSSRVLRRRVSLRLLLELYQLGVFSEPGPILAVVKSMVRGGGACRVRGAAHGEVPCCVCREQGTEAARVATTTITWYHGNTQTVYWPSPCAHADASAKAQHSLMYLWGLCTVSGKPPQRVSFPTLPITTPLLHVLMRCERAHGHPVPPSTPPPTQTNPDLLEMKDKELAGAHLSLVVSFAKLAQDALGIHPAQANKPAAAPAEGDKAAPANVASGSAMAATTASPAPTAAAPVADASAEGPLERSFPDDKKAVIVRMLDAFYDAALACFHAEYAALRSTEDENERTLASRGALCEESSAQYARLRKSFDQLLRNVSSLAESLDKQPPAIPESDRTTRILSMGPEGGLTTPSKESAPAEPLFDDEDTRAFYESLPDLRVVVPAVLLGDAEGSERGAKGADAKGGEGDATLKDVEGESGSTADGVTPAGAAQGGDKGEASSVTKAPNSRQGSSSDVKASTSRQGSSGDVTSAGGGGAKEAVDKSGAKEDADADKDKEKSNRGGGYEASSVDALLQRLPGCVSRDLIDKVAEDFCYVNSKGARRKLVRALFNVPRNSLELLPYYARLAATLSAVIKDIGAPLVTLLEEEFAAIIARKDPMNLEGKIRNIRFIAELTKFRVAPPGVAFSCLKTCLDDFTHHNIDVACQLLEVAGRFLYRLPATQQRTANLLDILMRLKNAKNMDSRQATMVENAYYQCKPPLRSARVTKQREPMQQFIRKLLLFDLDKARVEGVLHLLRKLAWKDPAVEDYAIHCLLKAHRTKYSNMHLVASVVGGISRVHDSLGIRLVDAVLEEIRSELESNSYGQQQRRVATVRLLGELYNYRLVDSATILDTLFLLISFGRDSPEELEELDPPEDFFRLRLVITLLETCGRFFDRGSARRKMDRFLAYFQRYIFSKAQVPMDIEFALQDVFEMLRPRMVVFGSYEEAHEAILEMEAAQAAQEEARRKCAAPAPGWQASGGKGGATDEEDSGHSGSEGEDEEGEEGDGEGEGFDEDGDLVAEDGEEAFGEDGEERAPACRTVGYDDDTVVVRATVASEEDEEFEREYRAMLAESSSDGRKGVGSLSNMSLPATLFKTGAGSGSRTSVDGVLSVGRHVAGRQAAKVADEDSGGVEFKVLLKKGNKPQAKPLQVPSSCSLALVTKKKEEEEMMEKQALKRLVLEYNEREEEQSQQAAAAVENQRVVLSSQGPSGLLHRPYNPPIRSYGRRQQSGGQRRR
eukprot:jgi/Mesvir1/22784/Mv14173-RA.2